MNNGRFGKSVGSILFSALLLGGLPPTVRAEGKLWQPVKQVQPADGENRVRHQCLTPHLDQDASDGLTRTSRLSLPTTVRADTTIRCLVLRFNFAEELIDDPNTTGRGLIDLRRPFDTPADSAAYFNSVGHFIDPPPHDSNYFDAHMRALNRYWNWVSEDRIALTWDIFPPSNIGAYQLAKPMSAYGKCDFADVVDGLTDYFIDCVHLADSAHLTISGHPNIDFSQYDAIFLFHAGSDRQNDIGFPETCSDLFTGFIRFGGWVYVDNGTDSVNTALMMPETASQDNRATALNAVLAHEFGHQLGLPDIYSTNSFLSQLGDFELMDNNGFGTGIDFGFPVGNVFGAIPVYPSAWCRAYLGLTPVVDYRQGEDLRLVAAEVASGGVKIARVPISESEYYLLENRVENPSGRQTAVLADSITSVIQGPVDFNTRQFNYEYDFLIPGSGLAIYYVDEQVAALDYDGDGFNNYRDNQLQIYIEGLNRKFLTLIEADGLVNFGGNYRSGFGKAADLFRDDRNRSFTPTSNPPTITNSGAQSRISISEITRDSVILPKVQYLDSVIRFNLETDGLASAFPLRIGRPLFGLSPVAADIDGDGNDEFIVASDKNLSVFGSDGRSLLNRIDSCLSCPPFFDSVGSDVQGWSDYHTPRLEPVPIFYRTPNFYSANPVVGNFGATTFPKLIAIGHPLADSTVQINGRVLLLTPTDLNNDGFADSVGNPIPTDGWPVALSFGEALWILTDRGFVYKIVSPTSFQLVTTISDDQLYGMARFGSHIAIVSGDSTSTTIRVMSDPAEIATFTVSGSFSFGPAVASFGFETQPYLCVFSPSGSAKIIRIDTTQAIATCTVETERTDCADSITVNPIVADIDADGSPDIIVGGVNRLFAFNRQLILVSDFPLTPDSRFPDDPVASAAIAAHTDNRTRDNLELIFSGAAGNLYSYGPALSYGFPLRSGNQRETVQGGSAVVAHDLANSWLGFIGGDGWFYSWQIDHDSSSTPLWNMNGADPSGSFTLSEPRPSPPKSGTPGGSAEQIGQFYAYENPVSEGTTRFRYLLNQSAGSVTIAVYDFSGALVATLVGSGESMLDQEIVFDCSGLTPGVYRAVLTTEGNGASNSKTTDIAVLR